MPNASASFFARSMMERSSSKSVSVMQVECTFSKWLPKIRFTLQALDEDFQTRVLFLSFGFGFSKENGTRIMPSRDDKKGAIPWISKKSPRGLGIIRAMLA